MFVLAKLMQQPEILFNRLFLMAKSRFVNYIKSPQKDFFNAPGVAAASESYAHCTGTWLSQFNHYFFKRCMKEATLA